MRNGAKGASTSSDNKHQQSQQHHHHSAGVGGKAALAGLSSETNRVLGVQHRKGGAHHAASKQNAGVGGVAGGANQL